MYIKYLISMENINYFNNDNLDYVVLRNICV